MISTFTIIPFMPGGWASSTGGFPAMTERIAFLMKDLWIFAASFYLLKHDVVRESVSLDYERCFHLALEKETSLDLFLVTSGEKSVEMDSSRHFLSESLLAISFWVANVNASLPSSNRSGGCS